LGQRYLTSRHKWRRHVEAVEMEDDLVEREGPRPARTASLGGGGGGGGGGGSNPASEREGSGRDRSSRGDPSSGARSRAADPAESRYFSRGAASSAAAAATATFSVSQALYGGGTFAGGSSGFGFNNYGYSSGGGQFGRFGGDIVKSDYDQERLLQQLMLSETLHLRIKKGAATVVDMLTPWQHPDVTCLPQPPQWPTHLREFVPAKRGKGEDEREEAGPMPPYQPVVVDELLDHSGSRHTTDGRRQLCSMAPLNAPCPRGCNCMRQVRSRALFAPHNVHCFCREPYLS